jgi:molybdopterin/thiamine biosynthesis adenylyltransferase
MFRYVAVTDGVLADIDRQVAAYRPERGGALLGPVGMPVVTRFVFDEQASTSGSTFQASRHLQARVSRIEQADRDLELKGMLHSHPGGMNYPSSGDRIAFADSLRGAPWLGRYIVPIVTCGTAAAQPHEVQLAHGTISVYVSEPRARDEPVSLKPASVQVLPAARDAAALAGALDGRPMPHGTIEIDGVVYLSAGVAAPGLDVHLLLPATYPTQAPLLLATVTGEPGQSASRFLAGHGIDAQASTTVWVPLTWNLDVPEASRLLSSIEPRPAAGPARAAGAAGHSGPPADETARAGIRSRLDGAESASLAGCSVLIAGAGSGGSLTAEALARSGVERFTLIDADTVEPENLSRSVYRVPDLGQPKVAALARRLAEVNPLIECRTVTSLVQDIPRDQLDELVSGADLVVAATDDLAAQRTLNHFAYARGVPAVFGAVYARAQAGEVAFTVPGVTKCFECTVATGHQEESQSAPRVNYGTGRLHAEPALGADIQHIVTASVKIAIGLLQLGDEATTSSSRALVWDSLVAGRNYLILSTVPGYGFFPKVFGDTPGQHAYQSVWLGAVGDAACPVCGTEPADPARSAERGPSVSRLRPVGEDGGPLNGTREAGDHADGNRAPGAEPPASPAVSGTSPGAVGEQASG